MKVANFTAGMMLVLSVTQISSFAPQRTKNPQIEAQKQLYSAIADQQETRHNENSGTPKTESAGMPNNSESKKSTDKGESNGTEFWPPFYGMRLKITDSVLACFTFVLAVFTGLLWRSTDKLWHAAKQQSVDTQEALSIAKISSDAARDSAIAAKASIELGERTFIIENRAYLCPIEFVIHRLATPGSKNIVLWVFTPQWKNTGRTPGLDITYLSAFASFDGEPPPDFADRLVRTEPDNAPKVMGAGSILPGPKVEVRCDQLVEMIRQNHRFFIWAWIEYDDIFNNTIRHRTEIGSEVIFKGDIRSLDLPNDVVFVPHGPFNGMDERCLHKAAPKANKVRQSE